MLDTRGHTTRTQVGQAGREFGEHECCRNKGGKPIQIVFGRSFDIARIYID